VDAAPLLSELRMIKTPQEIERMRLANDCWRSEWGMPATTSSRHERVKVAAMI